MNKTEFAAAVAEAAGASKKDAENIINATLAQIEKVLVVVFVICCDVIGNRLCEFVGAIRKQVSETTSQVYRRICHGVVPFHIIRFEILVNKPVTSYNIHQSAGTEFVGIPQLKVVEN